MKSIFPLIDLYDSINFYSLEEDRNFKKFYEELYNNSGFIQEFFSEPVLKINGKIFYN